MTNEEILEKVETLLAPILENLGYQLIERELILEQGRLTLRLYIDKETGVTIDDCATVSHAVEDLLEAEQVINAPYNLEVSSPGLNRPLKSLADFESHCGKVVRLKTREPLQGRSNYKGTLKEVREEMIYMFIDGQTFEIPWNQVAKAKLVVDTQELKGKTKQDSRRNTN